MIAVALLLLGIIIALLVQFPRTHTLTEEERLLHEYFRCIDRGEGS